MNQLLEFLNSHASVRKFTDRNITQSEEMSILKCAQRSPTSSNVQAYSIVSVRDSETKKQLAQLCGGQSHVESCPLFLVFCADMYRLKTLADQRGYLFNGDTTESFLVTTIDATLAAGRALQAAQAFGMGGVMVGGIRNEPDEISKLLHLPDLVYPVMGMSLGWPVADAKQKPRLPEGALFFSEKYGPSQIQTAVNEYDETIMSGGHLAGRHVEPEKYQQFDGDYSWSEHTARRMASDDSGTTRLHMLDYLNRKGFLLR